MFVSDLQLEFAEPELVLFEERHIVGIATRTNNVNEANPSTARIPLLWRELSARSDLLQLPNSVDRGHLFGVYSRYENRQLGEYSVVAGTACSDAENVPFRTEYLHVPTQKCLRFSGSGQRDLLLLGLWQRVYNHFERSGLNHERCFTFDVERYELSSQRVDLFVAIRPIDITGTFKSPLATLFPPRPKR
jgi:predicted transcriptional regulator YdeE